ncbi:helix-turn-helix domain-containing protein [Paenibacillus sp. ClWae2A]|uniref:helix-turn-helix domain-containing protein n=1 Tax=Paenibacillus sp. ClWae2A TaxID=3057177 RepID=UPI0028F5DA6C|nr:helix-turn-helix domain-containing protein [Paenibacillus sp. ClWae2A]MDT9720079.1 helix-turn-helix domain-containing protein [Paenibacillus sp. ClWae2A]
MTNNAAWVAQWASTEPLTPAWMTAGKVHYFSSPSFILLMDGKAIWKLNGHQVEVSYGQLIAVEENVVIEVMEGGLQDLAGWHIQFHTYTMLKNQREIVKHYWHVPHGTGYQKVQLTDGSLGSLSQQVSGEVSQNPHAVWVRRQHLIHELLDHLYQAQPDKMHTTEESLRRSVHYMQQHHDQVITRKQLAQISGMSPWHYSRKFSEYYGKPPLDFLAYYRIYRAQEELVLTSATSQVIAKKLGFEDAHYFSRRFKQLTGVSPREYAQTLPNRRIVCLSPLFAEVLIHLGIIPEGVMVTPLLLPEHQYELFQTHQIQMLEASPYGMDVEAIRHMQPELLIGNVWSDEYRHQLRTIAPWIGGMNMEMGSVLHQCSIWFHKQEEGRQLQLRMTNEVETARQQLQSVIESGATFMVLRVEPFGYRYLGGQSGGASRLLFGQLGLSLPDALIDGKAWFNPCSLDMLMQANPDYLFVERRVMLHFNVEDNMRNLLGSSVWKELKAVQSHQVFDIDTRLWVEGRGIIGQSLILNEIVKYVNGKAEH